MTVATYAEPPAMSWESPRDDHATTADVAPGAPSGYTMSEKGRLRLEGLPERDRLITIGMHLWWLATLAVGPLAAAIPIGLWLWRRTESPYLDDHGREVINFGITQVFLTVVLTFTGIGVLVLPVVWGVGLVGVVRGGLAASRNELYRYPMTFRIL